MAAILAMAVLAAALVACSGPTTGQMISLTDCTVQDIPARCGSLKVKEDRLTGKGRSIAVGVVVLPASVNQARESDPIVFLAGGPGVPAISAVGDMRVVLADANRHHDLVFVDQRGLGESNPLLCADVPQAGGGDADSLTSVLERCLTETSRKADVRFYTTAMASDDLADVLNALGYTSVDLYGASYGATFAQVFLRRHADMVRTATLIAGTLVDIPIFERIPAHSQAALDHLFARCAADSGCGNAFPDLRSEWESVLRMLAADPIVIPADPVPADTPIVLTPELLATAVHDVLNSDQSAVEIPLIVHGIATAPDPGAFASKYVAELSGLVEPIQLPVMSVVTRCNETWAEFDPKAVSQAAPDSYYLTAAVQSAEWWKDACAVFPSAAEAAEYGGSKTSDVPVLIMNGDADPQDPPANMAGAAAVWPNSLALVASGQSHNISDWSCQARIVSDFIERGTTEGLISNCLAHLSIQPFPTG